MQPSMYPSTVSYSSESVFTSCTVATCVYPDPGGAEVRRLEEELEREGGVEEGKRKRSIHTWATIKDHEEAAAKMNVADVKRSQS